METEVGLPLEYSQKVDFNDKIIERQKEKDESFSTPIDNIIHEEQEPIHYYNEPVYSHHPPQPYYPLEKPDFFSSLDKTTYIMAFLAFILGYFMGKTVQPVIIRPG